MTPDDPDVVRLLYTSRRLVHLYRCYVIYGVLGVTIQACYQDQLLPECSVTSLYESLSCLGLEYITFCSIPVQ